MVNKKSASRPKKPFPDFPLTYHPCGQWCKKIKGKLYYFGTDAGDALVSFLEQRDDLYAGRTPTQRDALTLRRAVNHFLTSKQHLIDSGELKERTFSNYKATCGKLIEHLGAERIVSQMVPADFQRLRKLMSEGVGLVTLRNNIRISRMIFNHVEEEGLIEERIRYGKSFSIPSKDTIRRERTAKQTEHGLRMFEATEIRLMLEEASDTLRAMILLAINCGFGQTDCSLITTDHFDFDQAFVDFPRPKTGVPRLCPLWPESVSALRKILLQRSGPSDGVPPKTVFLTKNGRLFVRATESTKTPGKLVVTDNIGNSFNKLLRKLKMKRPGVSFYALRHTLETIAGEGGDQVAVNAIMGHADQSMAGLYRERISIVRLTKVTTFVHDWLFPAVDS